MKIEQKIVGVSVVEPQPSEPTPQPVAPTPMHEAIVRPSVLHGATIKLKTPLSDHALYVTINHIVLDANTPHERLHPFEVFINSKEMQNFQWIVALTRLISAVFRKGGSPAFLVEELQSVFDPNGGAFIGRRYVPSLVAQIGDAIATHLRAIGALPAEAETLAPELAAYVAEKTHSGFPPGATLCNKCLALAVVVLDGCATCLSCGDSKCG